MFHAVRTIHTAGVLTADVVFEAQITKAMTVQADIAADVVEVLLRPVYARLEDGVLVSGEDSTPGVDLVSAAEIAIDGGFSYLATFKNESIDDVGLRVGLADLTFPALDGAGTFDLKDAAPIPASTAVPTARGAQGIQGRSVDDVEPVSGGTAAQFIDDTGNPIGDPLTLPSAAWGSIIGKPNLIVADDVAIPQGMVEFRWILPTAVYLNEPYRHVLFAALGNSTSTSDTPMRLLVDVKIDTWEVATYQWGTTGADDHNSPSVWSEPGELIVCQNTLHGAATVSQPTGDTNLRYRVGLPDLPQSIENAPDQVIDMGALTAYGQAWKDETLTNSEHLVLRRLYRRNLVDWYLLTETINRQTLVITTDAPGVRLVNGNGLQCYCTSARGSQDKQVIRVAGGLNPSSDPDQVIWFEINLATGDVTSDLKPSLAANLDGTDLPLLITDTDIQLLPSLSGAKANYERRLMAAAPWPGPLGVLTTEADPTNRAATAHSWLHRWGGEYTEESEGDVGAYNGMLIPTAAGASAAYAKTTSVTSAAGTSGFKYTVKVKLPSAQPPSGIAWLDLGGQLDDVSNSGNGTGWQLWLGAQTLPLTPRLVVNRAGGATSNLSATSPLAGATWGDEVWIRATYTVASSGTPARRCTIESSLNSTNGVDGTWTEIGAIAGNSGAIDVNGSAYTFIGARTGNRAYGQVIKYAKIEIAGVTKTEINFAIDTSGGWPGWETAYTDTNSNAWVISGAAVVQRTAYGPTIPPQPLPVSHDLGYVGDSIYSSYYPGAAFDGDAFVGVRTNGANQEYFRQYFLNNTLYTSVQRSWPTSDGHMFRPMPPDNGGPVEAILLKVTSYGTFDFYVWASSAIAVRRL